MRKQILLTLVVGVLMLLLPMSVSAAEHTDPNGYVYEIVSGSDGKYIRIIGCDRDATTLMVPETIDGLPVKELGESAFVWAEASRIVLPRGLVRIGDEAFFDCENLTEIVIPEGVTSIGDKAFEACYSLREITIPGTVTEYGSRLFADCPKLTKITVSKGGKEIGDNAFRGSEALTELDLPEGLLRIGNHALRDCPKLVKINIPTSVTCIGCNAFEGCTALQTVKLPEGLQSIQTAAFRGCSGLQSINIPKTVTELGQGAFCDCTALQTIAVPVSVGEIGWDTFKGCSGLTEAVISPGVASIGDEAFANCSSLTKLVLSEGLTYIDERAFFGCTALPGVNLPNTLTELRKECFSGCTGMKNIVIPDSVTYLREGVFEGCVGLKTVTLSESLKKIPKNAFAGCSGLTAVTFPKEVWQLEENAFGGCSGLRSVTFERKKYVEINETAFTDVCADVFISEDAYAWTSERTKDYGGTLNWNHSFEKSIIDPTCTEKGYIVYKCTVCGDSVKTLEYQELGHSYELVLQEPGCTEQGQLIGRCQCGDEYVKEEYPAVGHIGGWFVVTPSTENSAGMERRTCSACGLVSERAIPEGTIREVSDPQPFESFRNGFNDYMQEGALGGWDRMYTLAQSFLFAEEDGTLLRVEYDGDEGVVYLERYDASYELIGQKQLLADLPLFGGAYATEDRYYLFFGQYKEKEEVGIESELIRIVQFDKEWNRIASTDIYSRTGQRPFRFTNVDVMEMDGFLYIQTSAAGATTGNIVQRPLFIRLDPETMEAVTDDDSQNGQSASACQFIAHDGEMLVIADHNAYKERAVQLVCYAPLQEPLPLKEWGEDLLGFEEYGTMVSVLPIGENDSGDVRVTGVNIGGFEISESGYLIAGTANDQDRLDEQWVPNVFVSFTPREELTEETKSTIRYLTEYTPADVDVAVTNPQMVEIHEERYLVLWTLIKKLNEDEYSEMLEYCFVDSSGAPISEVYTVDGALSDCQPILWNGSVVWYVAGSRTVKYIGYLYYKYNQFYSYNSNSSVPAFYAIDGESGAISYGGSYPCAHGHDWSDWEILESDCTKPEGWKRRVCADCGAADTQSIPKADLEHKYVKRTTEPTCTQGGEAVYTCSRCDASYTEEIDALGHDFADGVCSRCGIVDPNAPKPAENPFADVPADAYFHDPVLWAVERGISSGTAADRFSPDAHCSRGQIVTFLWRMAGSPEPAAENDPFVDVAETDYYYKAVLWAVGEGITAGVSEDRFGPDSTCTRGQIATFLWRFAGSAEPDTYENPFVDVTDDAYYYRPVLWALEKNITAGTGKDTFGPDAPCTRGQVVTFLYRMPA